MIQLIGNFSNFIHAGGNLGLHHSHEEPVLFLRLAEVCGCQIDTFQAIVVGQALHEARDGAGIGYIALIKILHTEFLCHSRQPLE